MIAALAVGAVASALAGASMAYPLLSGRGDGMSVAVAPADPASSATRACPAGGGVADSAAELVRRALEFRVTVDVPPVPDPAADPSTGDRAALVSRGTERARQLFGGAELARELDDVRRLDTATEPSGAVTRPLAGGVSAFACTAATVTPTEVVVEARATSWTRTAGVDNGVVTYAQPSNVVVVRATVSTPSDHAAMTVDSLTWDFADGSGP